MAGNERTIDFLPLVDPEAEQEDVPMFTVHCPTHGTDVLLSERRIEGIDALPDGHELRWRCWCGTPGVSFVPRHRAAGQMVGRHRPAV